MKTKVLYIYGAPAVGKLTVATALQEATGVKVMHNHLASDLVRSVFERGDPVGDMQIVKLRFEMLEMAVREHIPGVIMTCAYTPDHIYPNGETDEWYVQELQNITERNGGTFYGIHLIASTETLLQRVVATDRLQWKKIHTPEVLQEVIAKRDYSTKAPLRNTITIDNTDLTSQAVVEQIRAHIGL